MDPRNVASIHLKFVLRLHSIKATKASHQCTTKVHHNGEWLHSTKATKASHHLAGIRPALCNHKKEHTE
jgi:hypothetical protein